MAIWKILFEFQKASSIRQYAKILELKHYIKIKKTTLLVDKLMPILKHGVRDAKNRGICVIRFVIKFFTLQKNCEIQ